MVTEKSYVKPINIANNTSHYLTSQYMAKKIERLHASSPIRFGAWLRYLRESKNLPLRVIAAAAEMDQAHLSKVELGHRLLTPKQSIAIAEFFQIDPNEIEARRIAECFQSKYSNSPAVRRAITFLHENQSNYRNQNETR